jgi:hypothetical protein
VQLKTVAKFQNTINSYYSISNSDGLYCNCVARNSLNSKRIEELGAPPPLHFIFLCIFVSPPIWASYVDARFLGFYELKIDLTQTRFDVK